MILCKTEQIDAGFFIRNTCNIRHYVTSRSSKPIAGDADLTGSCPGIEFLQYVAKLPRNHCASLHIVIICAS